MARIFMLQPYQSSMGAWENSLRRTFRLSGHEIKSFDYRFTVLQYRRQQPSMVIADILARLMETILSEAAKFQPDLIYVSKGELLYEEALTGLRSLGAPLVNWIGDGMWLYPFIRRVAPFYDRFFTFDSATVEALLAENISGARYLPFGFDPTLLREGTGFAEDGSSRTDVVFIGSPDPIRVKELTRIAASGLNLALWGGGEWAETPLAEFYRGKSITGTEMLNEYRRARIVLNIHRGFGDPSFPPHTGINNRVFETGGAGAFCFSSFQADMLRTFQTDIPSFRDSSEMLEMLDRYGKDDAGRMKTAQALQSEILSRHTMASRLSEILSEVGL
jgi:hypothetical protein